MIKTMHFFVATYSHYCPLIKKELEQKIKQKGAEKVD